MLLTCREALEQQFFFHIQRIAKFSIPWPEALAFENIWWALEVEWKRHARELNEKKQKFLLHFRIKLFTAERKFVRLLHQFIWLYSTSSLIVFNLAFHISQFGPYILVNFSYDLFIYLCLFAKNINYFGSNVLHQNVCVWTRVWGTITSIRNLILHAHRISVLSWLVRLSQSFMWLSLQTHVLHVVSMINISSNVNYPFELNWRFYFISNMPFDATSLLWQ